MNILHTASVDALISRYPCFQGMKDMAIWEYETESLYDYFDGKREDAPKTTKYRWDVPRLPFFNHLSQVSVLPVMFIGKTGYGKSSLINQIIGRDVFKTDDVSACTKEIDAAFFRLGTDPNYYLSLSDLPGIGESKTADQHYLEWYAALLKLSPCVVYVLRADQRDWTLDEQVFNQLFADEDEREKVIIALNFADKIEPISRNGHLSEKQLEAIECKVDLICSFFDVPSYSVIPCCAITGYGVDELLVEVTDNLEQCVFEPT